MYLIKLIKVIALYSATSFLIAEQLVEGLAISISQSKIQQITPESQQNLNVKSTLPPQEHQQLSRQQHQVNDLRRPIWALAHMVNSIKELDYRLGKGANAVEADITFSHDGYPLYTYHGPPCDCWRHCHQSEDFNDYLNYIRKIAIDQHDGLGRNLSILFLDLKLDYLDQESKIRAGVELAKSVAGNLYLDSQASQKLLEEKALEMTRGLNQNTTAKINIPKPRNTLKLILSINHVTDLDLVHNFIHFFEQNNSTHLLERIGFDVGMNDDLQQIESMWKKFGSTINVWQGDGYTNCFSPFYNLERLTKALTKRDIAIGYPRKVYHWTIDLHDRMRESLKLGVDAVMTNHPERLITVLHEPEIAHDFRLATRDDDPFKKIINRASSRSSESARFQRSTSASQGGFLGNMIDVIQSWLAYIREIPFLSLPTTSKFMQKSQKRHKSTETIILASKSSADQRSQVEYRVDHQESSNSSNNLTSHQSDNLTTSTNAANSSDSLDKVSLDNEERPFEGPKWYTSLVSNVLVTMMKMVLPV